MNMMSHCDVKKNAHQIQITTIRHWVKPPTWKCSAYATGIKRASQNGSVPNLTDTADCGVAVCFTKNMARVCPILATFWQINYKLLWTILICKTSCF